MSGLMYGAGSSGSGSGAGGASKDKPDLGMDSSSEKSFVHFFNSMPPKDAGTVRLFDRVDFYSAHGEDAIMVATNVFKTLSVVKYLGAGGSKNGLPSVTMSIAAAKAFLREALTSSQMRVEVWKGAKSKKSNEWTLDRKVRSRRRLICAAFCRPQADWRHLTPLHRPRPVTFKMSRTFSSCTQTTPAHPSWWRSNSAKWTACRTSEQPTQMPRTTR